MRKSIKTIALLLVLTLVLQLAGAAGEIHAEGAPDGSCAVVWSVAAKDAEGSDQTFTTAEQVADTLGAGFALDWGKDAEGSAITAPTVADLRANGVKITPPAGYTAASVLLVAEGADPAEGSRSLLSLARGSVDGSGSVTLPSAIFAADYDASAVGAVFNGSGSTYVLRLALERVDPDGSITLRYTAGELASTLGDTALFTGGNSVTLSLGGAASVSGTFADLDADMAAYTMNTLGKQFDGWKLILDDGASAFVAAGDPFTLSCSATLEAQWKDYDNRRPITFRVEDVTGEYNGTAYVPTAFSITKGSLAEGDVATASYSGQQTLPGQSTGTADFTIKNADGDDVTSSYNISVVNGKITVSQRSVKQPLTVTISAAEKEYDGTADVSAAYSITDGSLLGSDSLVVESISGSITGVGSGSVEGSFAVHNGEADVSANYEITVIAGALTVKPRSIVLTADSDEKDFDGTPLTKNSFTVSSGTLVGAHKVTATVTGSQTDPGSSANKIDPLSVKVMDGENDVTGLYSVRLVDGTLTVKGSAAPIALTIKMKSAEKVYDGKALTSKEYEIKSGALAEGDTLVIGEVTGEQTDAGESSVTAVFTVKHGDVDVTANYTLTVEAGTLKVKARPITITAASDSMIFNGHALERNSFKITSGELVKGHKLTASVSGSQTDVGSSANVVVKSSIRITDGSNNEVTKNYDITTAAGTLTVTRDPVTAITLSLGDVSKVYDGKPYRFLSSDIKVSSGSLPSGYTIEATFSPESATDVGKYDVTIKNVTIKNGSGTDVTSQFNITRVKGTLTITARPLTIETKAANKVYDGTALTERSTPTISGRVEGHQVTLRITGSQTKVGSSDNTVSDVKITDKESGADVTKNYAISYQYGRLTVTEASSGSTDPAYTWVSGSAGTLFISFSHDYDGFEGLQVDGKDLDRSNYTSASGSTEIWLKADYLNTLSVGTHTLKAKYSGGETAQTDFTVKAAQSTRTGDSNHLALWILIMATALIVAFAAAWYLFLGKDRRWKKQPVKKNK